MHRIAKFEKVSLAQFTHDAQRLFPASSPDAIQKAWEALTLPVRATAGSAGYDFRLPFAVEAAAGQSVIIPSGIRCAMAEGWVLLLFPRSSLGFRHRMRLDNTVGVIDADYHGADNEGHILIRFTADEPLTLPAGSAFAQGVFVPFGICEEDDAKQQRCGGFGSTGR